MFYLELFTAIADAQLPYFYYIAILRRLNSQLGTGMSMMRMGRANLMKISLMVQLVRTSQKEPNHRSISKGFQLQAFWLQVGLVVSHHLIVSKIHLTGHAL